MASESLGRGVGRIPDLVPVREIGRIYSMACYLLIKLSGPTNRLIFHSSEPSEDEVSVDNPDRQDTGHKGLFQF